MAFLSQCVHQQHDLDDAEEDDRDQVVPNPDHISIESEREKIPYFRVSSSVIKAVSIREKFKYPAGFYSNPAVS